MMLAITTNICIVISIVITITDVISSEIRQHGKFHDKVGYPFGVSMNLFPKTDVSNGIKRYLDSENLQERCLCPEPVDMWN